MHRIATACKGAIGAIPAIANSPATPSAWPPRAVLSPIAGSIPTTRSPSSGAATIDLDLSGSEAIDRARRAGNAGAHRGHESVEPGRTAVSGRWHAFTSNWRELTSHRPRIARPGSANLFCSGLFWYARSEERKPNLNYQFSHDEVTLLRLALGIALRQFEDCLDGETPQMLTYINQPSWSEASQAARAMIEQLTIPGVVVTISAQARTRN